MFQFTDHISIIIHCPESNHFQNCINDVSAKLKKWFKANKLTNMFTKQTSQNLLLTNKRYTDTCLGNKTI